MLKLKTKQWMYIILGWLFFATGFIGIFLPVLPTTPLMILALWAFSKGSARMHHWLYTHPRFGNMLQQWDKYRVIPIKAKMMAMTFMSASAIYLIFFSPVPSYAVFMSVGCMIGAATYVLSRRSRVPDHRPDMKDAELSGLKITG